MQVVNRTIISLTPVPKPRMTTSDRWRKRPAVIRYYQFKDELRNQVQGTLEGSFEVTFYLPMPKSWSLKKRQAHLGRPHQQKPDIDNLLKALMDSLCEDDSYVYDVRVKKIWAEVGEIELREEPWQEPRLVDEKRLRLTKPDMGSISTN